MDPAKPSIPARGFWREPQWVEYPALVAALMDGNAGTLLLHVGRAIYRGSPLYFGHGASRRYDDPAKSFGVVYVAKEHDLSTALMESVFHVHRWSETKKRIITTMELCNRLVRVVGVLQDIVLADLTQPNVIASLLGLDLHQITRRPYRTTQRLSRNIHDTGLFDGICYPSRNNPPAACFALFDRVSTHVDVMLDIDLIRHKDWPAFVQDFGILVTP